MNQEFTSERQTLENQFATQLQTFTISYANSRINDDGIADTNMSNLQQTLTDMGKLRDDIANEIGITNTLITNTASEMNTDTDEPRKEDTQYTASQQMDDSKHVYDHTRILLILKIGIVLLILYKGGQVYKEYKLLFVGLSLFFILLYLVFIFFFVKG